jgi:hypothetical protein
MDAQLNNNNIKMGPFIKAIFTTIKPTPNINDLKLLYNSEVPRTFAMGA